MNKARREGALSYTTGKVNPELEGYNGKTWDERRDTIGANAPALAFGLKGRQYGMNEDTRKESGQGHWATVDMNGKPTKVYVDAGATGNPIAHVGPGAEVPEWAKKAGAKVAKYAVGTILPFGGKRLLDSAFQRYHDDDDPSKSTFTEHFFNFDSRNPGEWAGGNNRIAQWIRDRSGRRRTGGAAAPINPTSSFHSFDDPNNFN